MLGLRGTSDIEMERKPLHGSTVTTAQYLPFRTGRPVQIIETYIKHESRLVPILYSETVSESGVRPNDNKFGPRQNINIVADTIHALRRFTKNSATALMNSPI